MYDLVSLKENEIFTNSKVIAEGTGNQHNSIQAVISKYQSDIEEFGSLRFEIGVIKRGVGATTEKIYYLNEEQATFVITLLRNSKIVVQFKKELVKQFYEMRRFILERQSKAWIESRENSKENRLKETDVIKQLVQYAKEQGSTHSDMLYVTYTKLAKAVIPGKRDELNVKELNALTMVEDIILKTIQYDMLLDKHYKEIYQDCKYRLDQFKDIAYIGISA